MLYLFGALMSVGKIRLSWRNFVKNWQSWDWKSWNLHQQWQYFLYFDRPQSPIGWKLEAFFEVHYPFIQSFSLLSQEDYEAELENLPDWWTKDWLEKMSSSTRRAWMWIKSSRKWTVWNWKDEVVHFGKLGIFWGKFSEESYYAKLPITSTCSRCLSIPNITIRNAKTFDKIGQMLKIIKETHNDIFR